MAFLVVSVQPALTRNQDISNFHGSPTLINRKLISYFLGLLGIVFCIQHVLTQNEIIWNFDGLLTLYNGKLISYFTVLWY